MADQLPPYIPIAISGAVALGAYVYARRTRAQALTPATPTSNNQPTSNNDPQAKNDPMSDPLHRRTIPGTPPPTPEAPGEFTTPLPTSPFLPGSCVLLASDEVIARWVEHVAWPTVDPWIDAYDIDPDDHEQTREELLSMAEDAFDATVGEPCRSEDNAATRRIRVLLLCEIIIALVLANKVDEELEDVLRICGNPSFDPWTNGWGHGRARSPSSADPTAVPDPVPPHGEPSPGGIDGVSNARFLSGKEEMSNASVLRLVEGQTADGAPIPVTVRRSVLLVADPDWPGLHDARRALDHFARNNPSITFVEASYADTRRHFGLPEDADGVVPWVLAGASPDGLAFRDPITPPNADDRPPSAEQWNKLIAHAAGYVASRPAQRLRTPAEFGELLTQGLARFRGPNRQRRPLGRRWRSRPPTTRNRRPWIGG